ncbi:MAG: HEPN domain-containing protein [Deltaproteobacteria bacterium]|nr:HEPN domain-containing protein [Deltaproteobacteria bacterium]
MKSMREEGLRLIREVEGILRRDARGALTDKDFNLVVRRAQEVVELALKGALKMLGVDYPKVHDVAPLFSDRLRQKKGVGDPTVLQKIEEASLWLAQSRAPSFYFDREYGEEDAEQALKDAAFVLNEVKELLGLSRKEP